MVERYRHYQPNRQRQSINQGPPRKRRGRLIFLLLLIVTGLFIGYKQIYKPSRAPSQKKENVVINKGPELKKVSQASWEQIQHVVDVDSDANPDLDISLSLLDVRAGIAKNFGSQIDFAAASTTKVLTAVAYLHGVEAGDATLDEEIGGLPASRQLKQMINQSNNESWAALNEAIGRSEIESYAKKIGMNSYINQGNTLKASDMALLLSKLADGKLINNKHQKLLYSFMQNTNNEDMIPGAIPQGATLYHKYGQLDDRLHDAAIVNYKQRPLVIVIYTKGTPATGKNYNIHTKIIQSIAENSITIFYRDL